MTQQTVERVARIYEQVKAGDWETVLLLFEREPKLAAACSRYAKASSDWTFLHQAAYFGHERAARVLIRVGSCLTSLSKDAETPATVAERRGHNALSIMLQAAARTAEDLWEAPKEPDTLPSSCAWREAVERRASYDMKIAYGGSVVAIPRGSRYFVDSFERTLIGWHGTYNPPGGMGADPMF